MLATDLKQKLKENAEQEVVKGIMNELRGTLVIMQQVAARLQAEGKSGGQAQPGQPADPGSNAGATSDETTDIYGGGNGEHFSQEAQPAEHSSTSDQAEITADQNYADEPEVTAAASQGDDSVEAEFRQTNED